MKILHLHKKIHLNQLRSRQKILVLANIDQKKKVRTITTPILTTCHHLEWQEVTPWTGGLIHIRIQGSTKRIVTYLCVVFLHIAKLTYYSSE